jgi:hypothetical protein
MFTAMSRRPYWLIECLDYEEALLLMDSAPDGSMIEEVGELVILWVPVPDDVIRAELDSPYI